MLKNTKTSVLFLLMSINVHAEITQPVISDEIKAFTEQTIKDRSSVRVNAYQLSKPKTTEKIKRGIEAMIEQNKQQQVKHTKSVKQLFDKTINNKAWKAKQAHYLKRFNKELGIKDKSNDENMQVSGHRLYLFVSSSMQKNKMRTYARQLSKYPNAQMLLRGFIGGGKKMQPTMTYIKSIIVKNENCKGVRCATHQANVNIDPVLFQRYQITKVPTLVYVDELTGGNYCSEGNTDVVNASGVHKFTGLAPLKYMIKELAETTKLTKLEKLYQQFQ